MLTLELRTDTSVGPKVYTEKDFTAQFVQHVSAAAVRWTTATERYLAEHGDQGTCVIGAGIAIRFKGPRKRTDEDLIIIASPGRQGSLAWEDSVNQVLEFLRQGGIEAHYCSGRMD